MKKSEKILYNILFIAGIILFLFSLAMLVYQIYFASQIDWNTISPSEKKNNISYLTIEFVTLVFKLVVSAYAIYTRKHLEETINPLFAFTILYDVFVVLQSITYFNIGHGVFSLLNFSNIIIDIFIAFFFTSTTLVFKISDWRQSYLEG